MSIYRISMAIAAAWWLVATPCMALECPAPQPAAAPDAIQESPAQISELSQLLTSGTLAIGFRFWSMGCAAGIRTRQAVNW
jgi:hypothetical protein